MKKLAIIHTTPATVDPLKELARELIGNIEIINFVDDSILPQLAAGGGMDAIENRWMHYAQFAEEVGANCILSACSSVGELVQRAQTCVNVPVLRIDEAMAEAAVARSERIGVAATLSTTLGPTMRLLQSKADIAGKEVELTEALAKTAYDKLMSGDLEGHDVELIKMLSDLCSRTDIVVLAQASMARVVVQLPETEQDRFLSSPRLGLERVRQVFAGVPQ